MKKPCENLELWKKPVKNFESWKKPVNTLNCEKNPVKTLNRIKTMKKPWTLLGHKLSAYEFARLIFTCDFFSNQLIVPPNPTHASNSDNTPIPAGYTAMHGKYYKAYTDKTNWATQKAKCLADGAWPAIIRNEEDYLAVREMKCECYHRLIIEVLKILNYWSNELKYWTVAMCGFIAIFWLPHSNRAIQ